MQIIPAIDIIEGRCVRLSKGDYSKQVIYYDDPLEAAKVFESNGLQRLHIVDLDGAKARSIKNLKVLEKISSHTGLEIDFGGGINTTRDVSDVFNAGAAIVTLGSIAVKEPLLPEQWLQRFGAEKFLIGADVLEEKIKISGWLEDAGISVYDFIKKMIALGARNFFCTDISRDGMMKGPSVELYKKILLAFPGIYFIASGGIATMQDVLSLNGIGCNGVIIGKAIYEGKISLPQLSAINRQH